MKSLIVGGGGFLGKNLGRHLHSAGLPVRIFERSGYVAAQFPNNQDAQWFFGNYASEKDIAPALENIDTVFLFASTTTPKTSNDDYGFDIESNLLATVGFLDIAHKHGVKKIVFPSSGGTVYGIPATTPITELHPTDPICSYGINKLAIEKYLSLFARMKAMQYAVLRISNPYGPYQPANTGQGVISTFIHKIAHDEEIEIWGDGSVIRDYVHVDDVSRAFALAAHTDSEQRIFNIGSGVGHDLNAILRQIEDLLGRKAKKRYFDGRLLDVPENILDIAMAKRHLGWEPRHDLIQGLGDAAAWLQSQTANK